MAQDAAPLLQDTLPAFLKRYKSNVSPSTRESYASALRRFFRYLDDEHDGLSADAPAPHLVAHLDAFLSYADALAQSGLSEATYRLYLTALGQWLDYLFEADLLDDGVTAAVFQRLRKQLTRRLNVSLKSADLRPEQERRGPPDELTERILELARRDVPDPDACDADRRRAELRRLRNVALLETLVSTGGRIGEVVGLNVGDLLDDHAAEIRPDVGKGDKGRVVFLDERAWAALQAYLGETRAGRHDAPIFRRHDRAAGDKVLRLGVHGAEHVVRTYRAQLVRNLCEELVQMLLPDARSERQVLLADRLEDGEWPDALAKAIHRQSGLAERGYRLKRRIEQAREITPHSFRHAFAVRVLDATGNLTVAQDMMGHESSSTTRRYAGKLSRERLSQAHQAAYRDRGDQQE